MGSLARLMLLAVLFISLSDSVHGRKRTIGQGKAASCTETAFDSAWATLEDGDRLEFDCGAREHTIRISSHKWTGKSVTIDGGNKIVLDGRGKFRHFVFAAMDAPDGLFSEGMDVTVKNIKLIRGGASPIRLARRLKGNTLSMNRPVLKQDGGSIYFGKRGKLYMSHVTITDSLSWGEPDMKDDVDERNYVTFRGGAVYIGIQSEALVEDCLFVRNKARQEGGAIFASWQTLEIKVYRSVFIQNEAHDVAKNNGGGAIYIQETFFTCEYCLFRENRAQAGGAIRNLMAESTLKHCVFSGNRADVRSDVMANLEKPIKGGAIYVDGARTKATGERSSQLTWTNCTFEENFAEKGGGVYLCLYEKDSAMLTDLRFCGNVVDSRKSYVFPTGAGLQRDCVGKLILSGAVMGGNTVTRRGDGVNDEETFSDSPQDAVIRNCDIPGYRANGKTVVPPGRLCKLKFCSHYPGYCI